MDEKAVFQNSSTRMDSPRSQKAKMAQNSSATNAFKDFSHNGKDVATSSPLRKPMLNKKLDPNAISGKSKQNGSSKAAVTELSPQALSKNKDLQTAVGGAGQSRAALGDVKDLGVVGGKKRTDQNDSQSAVNMNSQKEDSFQKLYSKELDLDEDEVPIILHELNDSAIHFISHEQYERSLSLLQKAQTLLDRLKFQKNPKDRFLIQVTMHNMALCFQKMGALEECALCLDACLHQINSQYLAPTFAKKPTKKLKKLKYECKIHMQVCALLSQLHRHEEALLHAKQAVQISQYLLNDLVSLCELNVEKTLVAKKKEQEVHEDQERSKFENGGMSMSQTSSQADLIYYDHSISMLERTALRVYPIIKEIQNRMVKHKDVANLDQANRAAPKTEEKKDLGAENQSLNMKVLLGYLNQSEWLYLLNIGNIMQITPLTIHDLYSNQKIDVELSRDSILEKITFLAISYFCVSTELRFLVSSKEKLSFDPVYVKAESEFWHGKALDISCGFLPSESPLVTHILSSYQKHHAPVQQAIPENSEEDQGLRVIRPEKGIDKSQFQPIIRLNKHLNIALSPLRLSPNNHRLVKKKKAEVKETGVSANLVFEQQQPQLLNKKHSHASQSNREDEAILLQAAALHNPSKRSIEFSSNQTTIDKNNPVQKQGTVAGSGDQSMHQPGGPDIVEYELQSFDQSDIQTQGPVQKTSGRVLHGQHPQSSQQQRPSQRDQDQAQHQQRPQTQTSTTPNRQAEQNNKIQMAVPSPNALASAMQREQRESLSHSSIQERSSSQLLQETAQTVQTQRNANNINEHSMFSQDKSSASFHGLSQNKRLIVNDNFGSNSNLIKDESISEEDLIKMASEGIQNQSMNVQTASNHRKLNDSVLDNSKDDSMQTRFENRQKSRPQNFDNNVLPDSVRANRKQPTHDQHHQTADIKRLKDRNDDNISDPEDRISGMNQAQQQSSRQSQRSRSKGKLNKKKGVMTQPQTHQHSANTTAYEPIRQALQNKEISHFNAEKKRNEVPKNVHSLEASDLDQSSQVMHQKTRPSHTNKSGYKGVSQQPSAQTKAQSRVNASSLETREIGNGRPPSQGLSKTAHGERPDSRRMIGGKRRVINKDQQAQQQTKQDAAVRSNSAGRRNQIPIQGYKTNDQSMTSASSHVQFNMNGQLVSQGQVSAANFKTFQQTRKAVTAHSTQASNSPRKGGIPSAKYSESTTAQRLGKAALNVQDPVFMNTNQLNQSRSTIENNNSTLVDRSMNDQLMLNNSSFEVGNTQSRSRSFAKTGGLSQQNSRDVILGSKKKNIGQQQTGPSSKSQGKQKPNKEMLNYLNQGSTAAQKNMNALMGASSQPQNKYHSGSQGSNHPGQLHHNLEIDYRKQLLIKQALDIQQQTKEQQRQKSGPKTSSNRNQMAAFQTHTSSVQMPMSHTNSVQQQKQQSHSSQGLRKSSHGITKEGNNAIQSQKILSSQQQVAQLDPHTIAAISQALNLKTGQANQQQNAQLIYNQILQYQHQQTGAQGQSGGQHGKKQNQNTHNIIKKFLKDRATPQPQNLPQSQSSALLGQQVAPRSGQSLSPTPGSSSQPGQKISTTLIDNFTQAPFLASSQNVLAPPSSKQAHTTKASAETSSKQRTFNAQKIYSQKQPLTAHGNGSNKVNAAAANSYFTEQPQGSTSGNASRKNAQDRFTEKKGNGQAGEPGQREPTPVFLHKPYQKPTEDPQTVDSQAQYPMQPQKTTAKQQLAAMYKSMKGGDSKA